MVIKSSNNLIEKVNAFPGIVFLVVMLFIRIAISYIFSLMSKFIRHKSIMNEMMAFSNKTEELLLIVLAGPLVETFIFQYLPFYFLKNRIADVYIIILAAVLFAAGHGYNWVYVLGALLAGILYGTVYAIKSKVGKGFLYTLLLHVLYNAFAFGMKHL
jgi:uncharacterized protein